MLTPIELQGKTFKTGMGYTKRQVDSFLDEIYRDYEQIYKENIELKDKITVLSEGLQYYKSIEKTLQKALVLAEKTSSETQEAAQKKASGIEKEAYAKAELILSDAKKEFGQLKEKIYRMVQQFESYKMQYKQLASTQLDMLNSDFFHVDLTIIEELKIGNMEREVLQRTESPLSEEPTFEEKEPPLEDTELAFMDEIEKKSHSVPENSQPVEILTEESVIQKEETTNSGSREEEPVSPYEAELNNLLSRKISPEEIEEAERLAKEKEEKMSKDALLDEIDKSAASDFEFLNNEP